MIFHRLYNVKEEVKEHLIEFAYVYVPLFGLIVFALLVNYVKIDFDKEFKSNMINISGMLTAFY